ncbi:MAG: hypothetical protein HN348_20155 [Proteobacteria bacterium]|nr:hypothetical protein [Pseudomonadota bacterium]
MAQSHQSSSATSATEVATTTSSTTSLTPELIERAHELIEAKPEDKREDLYRQLQEKVSYGNQRDNLTNYETPYGGTCHVTSAGMAMQAAGISVPTTYKDIELGELQYEERVDAIRSIDSVGEGTNPDTWVSVIDSLGHSAAAISGTAGTHGVDFWTGVQDEHLSAGHGVWMSIRGHIVRLQECTADGIIYDDPYGERELLSTAANPDVGDSKRDRRSTGNNDDKTRDDEYSETQDGSDVANDYDSGVVDHVFSYVYYARN